MSEEKKIILKKSFKEGDPTVLIDFLVKHSELSKSVLKKVLNNGGVWIRKFKNSSLVRVRRAQTEINSESLIELYYDPKYVNLTVEESKLLLDKKEWGIWFKPPGVMSQGNEFGDHASILRHVEKAKNKVWLIHRLDREASGIMLFAYTEKAARLISKVFQERKVRKLYKIEVLGDISKKFPSGGEITKKLDGKEAKTSFSIISIEENSSKLLVEIHTGRLHQIRRHFDSIGFPIIGDPKYGRGNKNTEGMKLMACQLIFVDPFTRKEINFSIE